MNFHRAFCSVSDYLMCKLIASMTKLGCTLCEGSKNNVTAWEPTEIVNQNSCFSSIYPVGVANHFTQKWRGEEIGEKNRKSQQMPPAPLPPSPVATLQLLLGKRHKGIGKEQLQHLSGELQLIQQNVKTSKEKERKGERVFINLNCYF